MRLFHKKVLYLFDLILEPLDLDAAALPAWGKFLTVFRRLCYARFAL
jgi:hypothetical protein